MMKINKYCFVLFFILLMMYMMHACTKDKAAIKIQVSDAGLFSLVNSTGYEYYKKSSDTLAANEGSAHKPYIRVRFNSKAQTVLDSDGKLPGGSTFPDSSVVVKEVYTEKGGKLSLYAVMMKYPSAQYSREGWLWAEYKIDGSVIISLDGSGGQCVSCHSTQGNLDFVRTFELH